MSIFLYSHGGSENHGCEAIVRGTKEIFANDSLTLYSNSKYQDENYEVDKIITIKEARKTHNKWNFKRILASMGIRLFRDDLYATKISVEHMLKQYGMGDIGLSIGGDNYCYPGFEEYGVINGLIRKRGVKTVLWGCSIESSMINDVMKADLLAYDLIVARECITYEALKKLGAKVVHYADPAFQLKPQKCNLPFKKCEKKIVGINISPHIISCETDNGMAYKNYYELINYILKQTDYQIVLIPHVIWKSNDDRKINAKLAADFEKNDRITVVEDHNCEELKYIISKCDFFVGARTHATIAAYSSFVPTLVVGYSVKARGIAKDVFGTDENYVLPVQNLKQESDLTDAFRWLVIHGHEIQKHLKQFIPIYVEEGMNAGNDVLKLQNRGILR